MEECVANRADACTIHKKLFCVRESFPGPEDSNDSGERGFILAGCFDQRCKMPAAQPALAACQSRKDRKARNTKREAVEDMRSLVRRFLNAFPYASLRTNELHEMLLQSSKQPLTFDFSEITRRFQPASVASGIAEAGISSPSELLALGTLLPMRISTESDWNELTVKRDRLMVLYAASLATFRRDRDQWMQNIDRLGEDATRNPCFHWLLQGTAEAPDARAVTK
jgi:hypothetical protein